MNPEILEPTPEKANSDKLLWIVAAIAGLLVIVAGVTYLVTRPKTIQPQKTATLNDCPAANKQHPGHCISSNLSTLKVQPGTANNYQFSVLDAKQHPIKDFETVHEKQMHIIVVRKDLAYFQHIHPALDTKTGVWTLSKLTLPTDGPYRLFADFTVAGDKDPVTIYEDINVGDMSKYKKQTLGETKEDKTFGRYQVILQTDPLIVAANTEAKLTYLFGDAQNAGQSINNLEPYLGAMGHAVILSENLDFIHAHAMTDKTLNSRGIVEFMAKLPKEGNYKVFGQFQHEGKVFTTDFVIPVYKSLAPGDVKINSGNDEHSGHGL